MSDDSAMPETNDVFRPVRACSTCLYFHPTRRSCTDDEDGLKYMRFTGTGTCSHPEMLGRFKFVDMMSVCRKFESHLYDECFPNDSWFEKHNIEGNGK